jgi:hypothetical protein
VTTTPAAIAEVGVEAPASASAIATDAASLVDAASAGTSLDAAVAAADAAVTPVDETSGNATGVVAPLQAPAPDAGARVSCKSDDDCWVSDTTTAARPIRRPAKLRGKKFRPCVDGDAKPMCGGGYCTTLGFGCLFARPR